MSLQTQYKAKCYICSKTVKLYSGFENWSILEKSEIVPLCEDCSKMLKDWIEFTKQIHTKKFKCAKCGKRMTKIDEHNWECKDCGLGLSVG
jgi:DNA-directed RNA polymerase subunit RPC12/RpoP